MVRLNLSKFMETVVCSISDDNMIHEADAHEFAGSFDAYGKIFIGLAWT